MAVQESSADRVRRFQSKVESSLKYVLAAAQSGKAFKTELVEGASELLDNTQHFMSAVTTLVHTSGGEAIELIEQVNAKRFELCGQLAELVRICDKLILAEDVPLMTETDAFAEKITLLAQELLDLIAPLIERRLSSRVQLSPLRPVQVRPTHGSPRGKYYSSGSMTISKTSGLSTSGEQIAASLPSHTCLDKTDSDSGYSNGDSAFSPANNRSFTMPKSMGKRRERAKLTRRPSGGNLFEVTQETKKEVLVPGEVAVRTRNRSSSQVTDNQQRPVKSTSLSHQKALSLSSPLLNQVRHPDSLDTAQKEALLRTISHTPNSDKMCVAAEGHEAHYHQPVIQRTRGLSHPIESSSAPSLPPKRRPATPGSRNVIVSDLFAAALPPRKAPLTSTQMKYPPSPEVARRSPKSSPPVAPRTSSMRGSTVTEIRVDSPDSWSPSESPANSLSTSSPSSFNSASGVSTRSSIASPRQFQTALTPRGDEPSGPAGPPPKPYHPTLGRPQSAMADLGSSSAPPEKPPHPTLRKNRSSKLAVIPDTQATPPPAKPPRPPTLTFNPDNPPPLPPKKKALLNYLESFGTYQCRSQQDLDFVPRMRLSSQGSGAATPSSDRLETPGQPEANGQDVYAKIPVSRTRSVFGSELNIPPPLPAKTKKGAGVKRAPTIRSNTSGNRRTAAIEEEPETSTPGRGDSPPQVPVGSNDSGVHTASDQLSEDDRLSQSSTPESYQDQDQEALVNLLYYSDVDYYLVFNEDAGGHSLLGGPVDALIAHAASDQRHESDRLYHEAFLLTYRTFVEPDILIEKLLERHDAFLGDSNDVICHATLSLLLRVVDEIKGSMDKSITERLLDTVFRLLCDNELKLGQLLHSKLFENLKSKGRGLRLAREALLNSRSAPPSEWNITKFRSRHVAQQLTLIDFAFYSAVEVHECLTWSVDQSEERCPTLTAFTEHFNNVSYWVRTRLLESEKKSERDKVMLKFVKIIEHLREMNNFNSMFALLAAMDCAAVNRMNWTKEAMKGLEEPRKIIDNLNGFKNYRDALEAAGSPCIPYLGLYLQDLTFINIGNPNMLEDNKDCVNFAKRWRQFKVMSKIKQYRQHGYESTKRDDDIIQYFNGFTSHLGEEELWERSMMLKPRGPPS